MEYFIDSNIFLRVFIKEKEKIFEDCYNFLKLVRQKKVKGFTSSLVLAEIDWILEKLYKLKKEEAVEKLESILRLKGLKITEQHNISLALPLYKKYNIKFIDALIASNPKILKKQMAVVSYDQDFDKLKIIRKEPHQILKQLRSEHILP